MPNLCCVAFCDTISDCAVYSVGTRKLKNKLEGGMAADENAANRQDYVEQNELEWNHYI